jgi:hypothetical protein
LREPSPPSGDVELAANGATAAGPAPGRPRCDPDAERGAPLRLGGLEESIARSWFVRLPL